MNGIQHVRLPVDFSIRNGRVTGIHVATDTATNEQTEALIAWSRTLMFPGPRAPFRDTDPGGTLIRRQR